MLYLVCTLYIQLPISIATVMSWEGFFFIEIVLAWTKSRPNQGLLYRHTEHSADFCWKKKLTGGGKKAPQITSLKWIFGTMIFDDLKKFTSRSISWGVKLYVEFTARWSLSCSNTGSFWQITWIYKFWPLTTISDYGEILNLLSFDLGRWQCKNWPCSYLWHA